MVILNQTQIEQSLFFSPTCKAGRKVVSALFWHLCTSLNHSWNKFSIASKNYLLSTTFLKARQSWLARGAGYGRWVRGGKDESTRAWEQSSNLSWRKTLKDLNRSWEWEKPFLHLHDSLARQKHTLKIQAQEKASNFSGSQYQQFLYWYIIITSTTPEYKFILLLLETNCLIWKLLWKLVHGKME